MSSDESFYGLPGSPKAWEGCVKSLVGRDWKALTGGLTAILVTAVGGAGVAAVAATGLATEAYAWLLANTATARLRRAVAVAKEEDQRKAFATTVADLVRAASASERETLHAHVASCWVEVVEELRTSEERLSQAQTEYFLQSARFVGRRFEELDEVLQKLLSGQDQLLLHAQFRGAAAELASVIRTAEFATIIDDRARDFVGRTAFFQSIQQALHATSSGYVVIQGEPGIGKTALMAKLVKEHGYVHHFNDISGGITEPAQFLGNVCAQLIVRFGLDHTALPPRATTDNGFLRKLLAEAVERKNGSVVVLVDALDEAHAAEAGANRLLLPPELPEGAHVVVTTRPEAGFQLLVDRQIPLPLIDSSEENLGDIESYVVMQVRRAPVAFEAQKARWQLSETAFVEKLCAAADGNFMYLVQVMRDIAERTLDTESASDIRKLPRKLAAYYERHLAQMSSAFGDAQKSDWGRVLAVVAVGRAPLTASYIARGAGVSAERAADVLRRWRMFLNSEASVNGERAWRIYHNSFREFLERHIGLGGAEDALIDLAMGSLPGREV